MTYTYQDLCNWRKEAQMELKKQKAKLGKTKSLSGKLGKAENGIGFFGTAVKAGALERLRDMFCK